MSETKSRSSAEFLSSLSDTDDKYIFDMNIHQILDDEEGDTEDYECENIYDKIENVPTIYEGSNINLEESILLIMELFMKHKWTKNNLQDILRMIKILLPKNNRIPNTVYKLFKYLQNLGPPICIQKHYYCKHCLSYKGKFDAKNQECSKTCKFPTCTDASAFYEIDMYYQIKHMFECRNLSAKLVISKKNADTIYDITDGTEYIRVNSRNGRGPYDLTLILNTDGVSLSKSSKSECWPLMFMIAELPDFLRESFLVITGIWHDTCKPNMNTFLKPFCDKLQQYFDTGIIWTHPLTKEIVYQKLQLL